MGAAAGLHTLTHDNETVAARAQAPGPLRFQFLSGARSVVEQNASVPDEQRAHDLGAGRREPVQQRQPGRDRSPHVLDHLAGGANTPFRASKDRSPRRATLREREAGRGRPWNRLAVLLVEVHATEKKLELSDLVAPGRSGKKAERQLRGEIGPEKSAVPSIPPCSYCCAETAEIPDLQA